MENTTQDNSPLMQQYLETKAEAGKEAILLFQMGDFYEMFFEDAERAAPALNIALMDLGKSLKRSIPMCGIPKHSVERYIKILTEKGFTVAISDETESHVKKRSHKTIIKPRAMMRKI